MYILPEFEFYLFDQAGWKVSANVVSSNVDAIQAHWNSQIEGSGNVVAKQKNYHNDLIVIKTQTHTNTLWIS